MNLVGWLFVFMEEIENNPIRERIGGSQCAVCVLDSCQEELSELLKFFELLVSWDEEARH